MAPASVKALATLNSHDFRPPVRLRLLLPDCSAAREDCSGKNIPVSTRPPPLRTSNVALFQLEVDQIKFVIIGFHAIALISSLLYLTLTKFFLDRIYAAFLLALYGVFLVIVILLGTGAVDLGI